MRNKNRLLTLLAALALIVTSCQGKGASSSVLSSLSSSEESSKEESSSSLPLPSNSSLPPSSSASILSSSSSSLAPKTYTVTWKNYDGVVLETDFDVLEGTLPTFDGNTPIKNSDAQYDYVWSGWSPEISPVSQDVEYIATYQEEIRKYTVIWKDENGSVLETDNDVPYGSLPTFDSEEPTKESDAQYTYVFNGFAPEISPVEGDAEYIATYQETLRKYLITFKDEDGTILDTQEVSYGSLPEFKGEEPIKEATERYQYTFDGWLPELSAVTGETEYVATYRQENRTYTIKWLNYDGEELEVDHLEYLATPIYQGEEPTRENDRAISYHFTGWSPEIVPVEGDQIYTATYNNEAFFSFDLANYELENGYKLSDLRGAPWINANLEGEIDKVKKPSLKDDFYTAINYEAIKNHEYGPFERGSVLVNQAMSDIYSNNKQTKNGAYLKAVCDRLVDGDFINVSNKLNNLDLSTFLSSKNLFLDNSSYLKIFPNSTSYLLEFNDGNIYGNAGLQTLWFYGQYDGYEYMGQQAANISKELDSIFGYQIDDFDAVGTLEKSIIQSAYNEYYYYGNSTTSYTVRTLPWEPVKAALLDLGLSNTSKIKVRKYAVNALNSLFNDYYVNKPNVLKNSLLLRLAFDNRFLMGVNNYRRINSYITSAQLFSGESNLSNYDNSYIAHQLIKVMLPEIFEQVYIELQGSADIKQTVSNLIDEILTGYNTLFNGLDWLSSTTKTKVLNKLNKMKYQACYSDVYKDFDKIDDSELESASLSSLFDRYLNVLIDRALKKAEVDDYAWVWQAMPSWTVNAFYTNEYNTFVILNGLVRGFMTDNMSIEELYGKLGTVIGHEITHAFDSTGSYYNEKGQYADLMNNADRQEFNEKVDRLIAFYKNIKLLRNTVVDGDRINGEAIADMGGVKVMLHLAKDIPDFDYDKFFKAFAGLWSTQPYNQWEANARLYDSHPFAYLRVNVTLAQFEEFVETYNLGPGDAMYIPESARINVW